MKIKQLEKQIGTLSNPSKMPSFAWGISAYECMVGSLLAKLMEQFVRNVMHLKDIMFLRIQNLHIKKD